MSASLRAMLAWLVILGCIGFFVWMSQVSGETVAEKYSLSTPQFTLQCRYVLGVHNLISTLGKPKQQAPPLTRNLAQLARTPVEKLRLVPTLGEIDGRDAAIKQLDSIKGDLDDPDLARDAAVFRSIYLDPLSRIEPRDRQRLIDHHGFFGRLALSFDQPASDPLRREVMRAADRTAIAAGLIFIVALLGLLGGLVLLILAIIFFSMGKLRRHYDLTVTPSARFLESFALYFLGMLALSLLFHYVLHIDGLWPTSLFLLLPLVFLWPAGQFGIAGTARILGWVPSASARFLQPRRSVVLSIAREIGAGIIGYVAGLPLLAIALVVTLLLSRFAPGPTSHPIIYFAGKSPRITLQLYLLACGVAPMVEETFFRGSLYAYLRPRAGYFLSALASSIIFAVIHPQGWTTIPVLATIGFILASIREWRHTLLSSMTAHALNNFIATTFLTLALS